MEIRPHRRIKLEKDPEAVAGFLVRRMGFRRTSRSPLGLAAAWAAFVLGPVIVVLAALLFGGRSVAMVVSIVLALAVMAVALLFVAALRRQKWYRGHGVRFRVEKVEGGEEDEGVPVRLRVIEAREPGFAAEIELPPAPEEPEEPEEAEEADSETAFMMESESHARLRPDLYVRLVPFLAGCFTSLTARSVSDTLAPRRASELRGYALLGEAARALERLGAREFRRRGSGPGIEKLGGWLSLLLPVIVAFTELGALVLIASFALAIAGQVVRWVREQPLEADAGGEKPIHLTDRLDERTYTVVLDGPGGEHAAALDASRILAGGFEILDDRPFLPALQEPFRRARNEMESHSGLHSPPPGG